MEKAFLSKGFKRERIPYIKGSRETKLVWHLRAGEILNVQIDEHGFVDLVASVGNKTDRITLPKPVRDLKGLDALMKAII